MKNYLNQLGLLTIVAISATFVATVSAKPVVMTDQCNVAVDVFNPSYDACVGAYDGNDNDPNSTIVDGISWSGASADIALGLLNTNDVFGAEDWTGLEKLNTVDGQTSVSGAYFTINEPTDGEGTIVFKDSFLTADFIENAEIAISFKTSGGWSLYKWDNPIWADDNNPEANVVGTEFKVDMEDNRFKAVLDGTDDRFGIDRTDPQYKETPGMREIMAEQTRRRKKRKTKRAESVVPNVSSESGSASKGASALSSLVSRLKQKVKD